MLELLRQGADPHAASNQKRTPLHEACMQGKFSYWETILYCKVHL